MKTVYVLTHGEYSDYGVVCVFENREDADKYCSALGGGDEYDDGYRVEEYVLYGSDEGPKYIILYIASVKVSSDGQTTKPFIVRRAVHEGDYGFPSSGDSFTVEDFDHRKTRLEYGIDVRVSTTRGEDVALKALWDRVAVVQARLAGIG